MAGDWIKIETVTPDKPEVFAIADQLSIDPDAAFGKLFRIWSWADQHTSDGNATSVTKTLCDRISGVPGFGDAMESAGWLVSSEHGLEFPNFDRHNGQTAKQRALTAKRVAKHKRKGNAEGNASGNDPSVTNALPREEKRREEKNKETPPKPPSSEKISLPPELDTPAFGDAWAEWEQHRKEIRKKLTPTAVMRQISTLANWGEKRAIEAIRFSIRQQYTGIFEENAKPPKEQPLSGLEKFVREGSE